MVVVCRTCGARGQHFTRDCPTTGATASQGLPIPSTLGRSDMQPSLEAEPWEIDSALEAMNIPGKDLLVFEANALANARWLKEALTPPGCDRPHYEHVDKGGLYSKTQQHVTELNVMFFQSPGAPQTGTVDRSLLYSLAGAIPRHLEFVNAKVKIRYAEENSPLDGSVIGQREEISLSISELHEDRLQAFRGRVEAAFFSGYTKTSKERVTWNDTPAMQTLAGLLIPVHIGIIASQNNQEHDEDRLSRMGKFCSEGQFMAVARNLRSMLNKTRVCAAFKKNPRGFPLSIRSPDDLCRQIDEIKGDLIQQINTCGRLESACSLIEAALKVLPDEEVPSYCKTHFGFDNMVHHRLLELMESCQARLMQHGQRIICAMRPRLAAVFPNKIIQPLEGVLDGASESPTSWQVVKWTHGCNPMEDHPEDVLHLQLKHSSCGAILSNLGFVWKPDGKITYTSVITWKDEKIMSRNQLNLKRLAEQMSFSSLVPNEVITGAKNLEDVKLIPDEVINPRFLHGKVPIEKQHKKLKLPELIEHMKCLQLPTPSISPAYVSGMIVFLDPVVGHDLPEIVTQCRYQGLRVGAGTFLVTRKYLDLVMSVLNPTNVVDQEGHLVKVAFSAHIDTARVLKNPAGPGQTFRNQGKMIASTIKNTRANFTEPVHIAESCSIQTRPTVSTGDLPKQPRECDTRHRPILKGSIRADGFHRERPESSTMNKSSGSSVTPAWEHVAAEDFEQSMRLQEESTYGAIHEEGIDLEDDEVATHRQARRNRSLKKR